MRTTKWSKSNPETNDRKLGCRDRVARGLAAAKATWCCLEKRYPNPTARGLLQLRLRYFALRLENRKLLSGRNRVGLRRCAIGLGLQQIGGVLLRLLDGAGAGFNERRVTMLLLLREGEGRLRLLGLFLRLFDAGLLGGDLRVELAMSALGWSTCAVA